MIGTEVQLILPPQLPVLNCMFKGKVSSTYHAIGSKWIELITQWAWMGNPNHPGVLEVIMDWPDSKNFGISSGEEVTCGKAMPFKELPE